LEQAKWKATIINGCVFRVLPSPFLVWLPIPNFFLSRCWAHIHQGDRRGFRGRDRFLKMKRVAETGGAECC